MTKSHTSQLCALTRQCTFKRKHRLTGTVDNVSAAQSTLEYALVLIAFISMLVALSALAKVGVQGKLMSLALKSSSHILSTDGMLDILLY